MGQHIKIIGVDPGLADTGIGIVEGVGRQVTTYCFGSIHTPAELPLAQRLDRIFERLQSLLDEEGPDAMVVEDVFTLRENPRSGILLAKVSGIVILAAARLGLPVTEVAVREAKQTLTGNGRASKEQLEKAVREHLNRSDPIRPFHASDALSLALVGFYRNDRCRRLSEVPGP